MRLATHLTMTSLARYIFGAADHAPEGLHCNYSLSSCMALKELLHIFCWYRTLITVCVVFLFSTSRRSRICHIYLRRVGEGVGIVWKDNLHWDWSGEG